MYMNLNPHTTRSFYLSQTLSVRRTSVEVLWRVSQQWVEAQLLILTITSGKFNLVRKSCKHKRYFPLFKIFFYIFRYYLQSSGKGLLRALKIIFAKECEFLGKHISSYADHFFEE